MSVQIPLADARELIGDLKLILHDIIKSELGDGLMAEVGEKVGDVLLNIAETDVLKKLEAAGYVLSL